MPLRASVTRRALWTRRVRYHYDGTYLMCEMDALGAWLVLDTRRPNYRLAGPFSRVQQAKVAAEHLLEVKPDRFRVKLDREPAHD